MCRRITSRSVGLARTWTLVLAGLIGIGCGGPGAPSALFEPPALPPLDRFEDEAREALQARHAAVQAALVDGDRAGASAALAELAQELHAYELWSGAHDVYAQALSLQPDNPRWLYLDGIALRELGQGESALQRLRAATALESYPPAWVAVGRLELEHNNFEAAGQAFRKGLERDTRCAACRVGLGRIALHEQRFDAARAEFERALELAPASNRIYFHLAMAHRGLGDAERAEAMLQRRGKISAGVADPWLEAVTARVAGARALEERAARLAKAGRYAEAAALLREVAADSSDDPTAHLYLGMALSESGDLDGGLAAFGRVLELEPQHERAHLFSGSILAIQGNDEAAIAHYRAAAEAHPGWARVHLEWGQALQRLGRYDDSIAAYDAAIREDPGNAEARLGRAAARVLAHRWAEARRGLSDDVRALPDQPVFLHVLARLHVATPGTTPRDAERGLELTQRVARTMKNTDVAETIAMAMAANGRFPEAIQWASSTLPVLREAGEVGRLRKLEQDLAGYRQGRRCTVPWPPDAPWLHPKRERVDAAPTARDEES